MARNSAVKAKPGITWSIDTAKSYAQLDCWPDFSTVLRHYSFPMSEILEAVRAGASGEVLADTPLPETTPAVFVRRDEENMFDGIASKDKDPRKSLHVG